MVDLRQEVHFHNGSIIVDGTNFDAVRTNPFGAGFGTIPRTRVDVRPVFRPAAIFHLPSQQVVCLRDGCVQITREHRAVFALDVLAVLIPGIQTVHHQNGLPVLVHTDGRFVRSQRTEVRRQGIPVVAWYDDFNIGISKIFKVTVQNNRHQVVGDCLYVQDAHLFGHVFRHQRFYHRTCLAPSQRFSVCSSHLRTVNETSQNGLRFLLCDHSIQVAGC